MATSALVRRSPEEGRRQPRRSRRLPAELLLQRFLYSLRGLLFRSPFYRLGGPADGTGAVAVTGADPWPGNAALGEAIALDHFTFAGQTIRVFLLGREDATLQTSFVADDFALTTS